MKGKFSKTSFLLAMILIIGSIFNSFAYAARTEDEVGGNPSLKPGGYRIEEPITKTYNYGDITIQITVRSTDEGEVFDFISSVPVIEVVTKGGNGAIIYYYSPGEYSDTGLHAPKIQSGKYADLSHLDFYFGEDEPEPEWKGKIQVEKIVVGDLRELNEEFEIKLYEGSNLIETKTVKAGQTIEFTDLDAGTYTIVENLNDAQTAYYEKSINKNSITIGGDVNSDKFVVTNTEKKDEPEPEWKGKIQVEKIVVGDLRELNEEFEIKLYEGSNLIETKTVKAGQTIEFTDLDAGTYTIVENLNDAQTAYYEKSINKNSITIGGDVKSDKFVVTNTEKKDEPDPEWEGNIRVYKIVIDGENEVPVLVRFLEETTDLSGFLMEVWQGETMVASGLTDEYGEVKFTGLAAGTYTIKENLGERASQYDVEIENNGVIVLTEENENDDYFDITVTNTVIIPGEIEKIDVTGTKIWTGGGPSTKPTIELQLYRDGEAFGEPITLENGETTYTWEELDKTDSDDNNYEYTIDEVEVPTRYRKSISEDGLTITNRYNRPSDPRDPDPEDPDPEDPDPEDPEIEVEEILDEETALGVPEVPIEVEDPEVPLATLPDTGAFMNTSILAAIGSAFVLSGIGLGRKKRK